MTNPVPELLAPAGDQEKLIQAIRYGADAVYLSARDFGLRAASANFSQAELYEAVQYAHAAGVRVYLALNILAHPADLDQLAQRIDELLAAGPDAVIVADPGIMQLVRQKSPAMQIHLSTQANTTNAAAALFWHEQGVKRIVLARELTLAEIGNIRRQTPDSLELEGFVHGAMCLAYSGRCLLSAYLTGRDANRGRCSQPCRWSYQLVEEKRPDLPLQLTEDARGSYLLNSRDMCLIEHIPQLIKAGLSSLKIEGRTKSAFYVATVVKAYRAALDAWQADPAAWQLDPAWLDDLKKTVHRPFDTGFYFSEVGKAAKLSTRQLEVRQADVVGQVKAWRQEQGLALLEQKNRIQLGDELELVQPQGAVLPIVVKEIYDLDLQPLEATPHAQMLYYLPLAQAVRVGSYLRRTRQPSCSND